MLLDTKYEIGEKVYLTTDVDQLQRVVTGYEVRLDTMAYLVACGIIETSHYEFEISDEINITI